MSFSSAAQWYYYLRNDPTGRNPDGWYEYDKHMNKTVEHLYQTNHQQAARSTATTSGNSSSRSKRARHLVPFTAISGFQYELDFLNMSQRNTQSGTERPTARTTNGLPPSALPGGGVASRATAVPAAAAIPVVVPVATAPPAHYHHRQARGGGGGGRRGSHEGTTTNTVETINYVAPERLHEVQVDDTKVYDEVTPPTTGKPKADEDEKKQDGTHDDGDDDDDDEDCAICLDRLWEAGGDRRRVVSLKGCQHKFHYECIHEALAKTSAKCPLCSKAIHQEDQNSTTSRGKCPSGTMSVKSCSRTNCKGFESSGTFTITYRIHGGTQKQYHPSPGHGFSGATRVAYLPNNQQGQDLLARMQYSFAHGLNFMVSTSLTTGQANVVTWASIHHKTSCHGGVYGFPDATYFRRSNDELDSLGVPADAAECRRWMEENI